MATVTGFTAAKMQELIEEQIIDAQVDADGNLTLITRGGQELALGNLKGPKGDTGPGGVISSINGKTGSAITLTTSDLGIDLTGLMPVGTIVATGRSSAPSGFVLCQGQSLSRTGTYANLFAAIGSSFTPTASTTNFNVPDLRGRSPIGLLSSNTAFNPLGKSAGEQTHRISVSEMPSHTHSLTGQTLSMTKSQSAWKTGAPSDTGSNGGKSVASGWSAGRYDDEVQIRGGTVGTGGGAAMSLLQPYQVVNYMIKI